MKHFWKCPVNLVGSYLLWRVKKLHSCIVTFIQKATEYKSQVVHLPPSIIVKYNEAFELLISLLAKKLHILYRLFSGQHALMVTSQKVTSKKISEGQMQNKNQVHQFKSMSKPHDLKSALGLYSKIETKLKF